MASKGMQDVTGVNNTTAAGVPQESQSLRRAVGIWGSYTWGYEDVGADVYVALGLVMAAAQGATNVAFLFAGLIYVMVGLCGFGVNQSSQSGDDTASQGCTAYLDRTHFSQGQSAAIVHNTGEMEETVVTV